MHSGELVPLEILTRKDAGLLFGIDRRDCVGNRNRRVALIMAFEQS